MDKKEGIWADLTLDQVELIDDIVFKREIKKKIRYCVIHIINPLYTPLIKTSFKFSVKDKELTCRMMISELKDYYYAKNVTREELVDQITNWHKKK